MISTTYYKRPQSSGNSQLKKTRIHQQDQLLTAKKEKSPAYLAYHIFFIFNKAIIKQQEQTQLNKIKRKQSTKEKNKKN